MFFLQRAEKHDKEEDVPLTNGHMNGHANGKINGLRNGSAAVNGGSATTTSTLNGYSGYKNGAVLANGVNGHTELSQRKVK